MVDTELEPIKTFAKRIYEIPTFEMGGTCLEVKWSILKKQWHKQRMGKDLDD